MARLFEDMLAATSEDAESTSVDNSEIPAEMVDEWLRLKEAARDATAAEMVLRKEIVAKYFPDAKEGSHTVPVSDGRKFGVTIVVNRNVDIGTLTNLREQLVEMGIGMDALVVSKPSLVISQYRLLSEERRMAFDQVLTITDGSPQVEVRTPKSKKGKK